MKKVLIAYFSLSGKTKQMAEYIAEGVRFSGQQAVVRKITEITSRDDLTGYDGYIFGSPTYYSGLAEPMKTFLALAGKAELEGKLGGAFSSYAHDGGAATLTFEAMRDEVQMEPFELGAFNLKELELGTFDTKDADIEATEGMRACQDYGRVFGEKLAN